MCVFCFLNKENQKSLRDRAQISTDRFEHTLSFYKKIYLEGLNSALDEPVCEIHKKMHNEKYLSALRTISLESIGKIFDIFLDAYIFWINNDSTKATKTICDYLEENRLFKEISLQDKLMFRVRYSESRLSHWDMFHIPFNKRYLIRNQRYSLVGRPMLYLGFSSKYVLKELGYNENDKNYYISGFYLKDNEKLKVCDFRYLMPDFQDAVIENLIEDENENNEEFLQRFKISVIASICSFKKRSQNNDFCEEYILPQIISEIVNEKGYQGLLYSSTKTEENSSNTNSFYDANAVIFTKYESSKFYDVTYVYDKALYQKFVITTPKKIEDITKTDEKLVKLTLSKAVKNNIIDTSNSFLCNLVSDALSNNFDSDEIEYIISRSIVYEIFVNTVY